MTSPSSVPVDVNTCQVADLVETSDGERWIVTAVDRGAGRVTATSENGWATIRFLPAHVKSIRCVCMVAAPGRELPEGWQTVKP